MGRPSLWAGQVSRIVSLCVRSSLRFLSFCWSGAFVCPSLGATKVGLALSSSGRFDQLSSGATELLASINGAVSWSGHRTAAGSGEHTSPGDGVIFQHGLGSILASASTTPP